MRCCPNRAIWVMVRAFDLSPAFSVATRVRTEWQKPCQRPAHNASFLRKPSNRRPAKAGAQGGCSTFLGSRLRGNDEEETKSRMHGIICLEIRRNRQTFYRRIAVVMA